MKDIKKVEEILEYLRDNSVRAVVAGGYVRDKVLGRQSKDIDIFVLAGDKVNQSVLGKVISLLDHQVKPLSPSNEGDPDIIEVLNSTTDDWQIDVIVRKENTIEEVLSHFPCSLSQAYTTYSGGKWEYKVSNYFQEYMNNNLVYFTKGKSERAEYKERMINKFDDAVFLNKHDMTPLSTTTVCL